MTLKKRITELKEELSQKKEHDKLLEELQTLIKQGQEEVVKAQESVAFMRELLIALVKKNNGQIVLEKEEYINGYSSADELNVEVLPDQSQIKIMLTKRVMQ